MREVFIWSANFIPEYPKNNLYEENIEKWLEEEGPKILQKITEYAETYEKDSREYLYVLEKINTFKTEARILWKSYQFNKYLSSGNPVPKNIAIQLLEIQNKILNE